MKGKKIGIALLIIQTIIAVVLIALPKLPISHAVNWEMKGTQLHVTSVRADKAQEEKLNQEVTDYLNSYNSYYEQNILHFHNMKIIASTPHISIIEIQTILKHNATTESKGMYLPAGDKTVQLWVYLNDDVVTTKWITVAENL